MSPIIGYAHQHLQGSFLEDEDRTSNVQDLKLTQLAFHQLCVEMEIVEMEN